MQNSVTLSVRLCIFFSTITSLPLFLVAQDTTSKGGIRFSFSSESDPLLGWSEIISGNEIPIEDWLPRSMQISKSSSLQSAIEQVAFQDELPNLPRPVRIVKAKPANQPKVIRVPADMVGDESENEASEDETIITHPKPTSPSFSLVAAETNQAGPPSAVRKTKVKTETEQVIMTETITWEARSTPLIDPSLCGSDTYRISDNVRDADHDSNRCGHCESCIEHNRRPSGLESLRSRFQLSRERFRNTLLGDASLFNERPHGSSLDAVLHAQTLQGAKARCAIWEFDFDRNPDGSPTAKLKPTSIPRLQLIADLMSETGLTLRLQSSGNSSLDDRRSKTIVEQLQTIGLSVPNSAIEVTASRTHEQSGVESEIQFRSRITQGVRGNSGASAPASSATLPSSN